MKPTNILIGQAVLVLSAIAGTLWASTQWAAYKLGYQAGLGEPWFFLAETPIHYPWRLFEWWYVYEAYAPDIFRKAGLLAASGGIFGTVVAITGSLMRARHEKNVTTYGSAHWADEKEILQSNLLSPSGVFLDRFGENYLRHDGPEHILVFAPTRSGKGVGLVIPTLLSWTGSCVVHDIKGENWRLTAGWRSKFSHCILFNPTDLRSAKYNPLLEVRKGGYEIRDVQNIADILVDPEGALEKRNHWEKTGHSLLTGAILHVLYSEQEKTLARVATFLADPKRTLEKTLRIMMTTNHLGTKENPKVHPEIASIAREMLNKSENELSGVVSTAMSFLDIYRDPIIAKATSKCDWHISDLKHAKRPVTLYLVVPPSDISRTKPLIRLILNQIGRRLTEELPDPNSGKIDHPLLLMLDEFPALGRLDFFETAMAFMAGYGIRAFLIAQSLNQIEKAYGPNNSILDNAHVRIAFATNDDRTAKRISDTLGTATELRAQKNYAGHRLAPWLSHVMVSRQETARPLLTPGEVMQLPQDEELVLVSGTAPIRAQKLRYYEDENFMARCLPAPELAKSGAYPDKPEGRGNDWNGQLKKVSRKLHRQLSGTIVAGSNGDDGGLRREPDLFDVPTNQAPDTPAIDTALLDDEFAADAGVADPLSRSQILQRAHALNNGDDRTDMLPDF